MHFHVDYADNVEVNIMKKINFRISRNSATNSFKIERFNNFKYVQIYIKCRFDTLADAIKRARIEAVKVNAVANIEYC